MAPARVFGAIAGRAFMVAVAKSVVKKKPAPSNRATVKVAVKKTVAPRTTNSGIQKVVPVFFEVGDFLGAPQVSQTEAVNKVWAYIKLQNLQVLFPFSRNVVVSLCDLCIFILLCLEFSALVSIIFSP